MSGSERDHTTAHNRHFWDLEAWFDEWENSDEPVPLRCGRCGFEARTIGTDMPPDCACDISRLNSYDDPSDHWPECIYFAGPSCPARFSTSGDEEGELFSEWLERLMNNEQDESEQPPLNRV